MPFKTPRQKFIEELEKDPEFWKYDSRLKWADCEETETHIHGDEWMYVKRGKTKKRKES